jgi:hypothetical protein
LELQISGSPIDRETWGVDLGLGISTNMSKVLDLGGTQAFNALSGRIMEGQPAPVGWDRRVANRDFVPGEDCGTSGNPPCWEYEDNGENVVVGPIFPTHFVTPSLTVRVPGNVTISARGEYRGGNFVEVNPIATSRSVRSAICFPYYVDPETSITLRDDTPALWRERCTPSNADDYWFDGDYFKLRSISASVPVDFAFPARISSATLTVQMQNAFDWYREIPWYDVELTSDAGAGLAGEGFANASERTPSPATLRFSLRVSF